MQGKFAVIGLGQFGTSIARKLAKRGAEVLAIDNDSEHVENIKEYVAYAVTLDATDVKALQSQNIEDMDAVVVAIGEDFEALLLTTVLLMDLKVKRIIARAANAQQRKILEKVGVEEILSPEDEVAKTVAETLLNPNVHAYLPLPDNYEIVEVNTPRKIANKTLGEIQLRERYNLNLITVKREYEEEVNGEVKKIEHIIGIPRPDTILYEDDIIIILGKVQDVEKFIQVNK
jgi:trk system potassium uptake protein TrkA